MLALTPGPDDPPVPFFSEHRVRRGAPPNHALTDAVPFSLTNRASAAGDRPPVTQHLHYLSCTHQPLDPRAASARPLQALVRPHVTATVT